MVDIEALKQEREAVVRELNELQAWLGARDRNHPLTQHLRHNDWMRERAAKTHRYRLLSERAKELREAIKVKTVSATDLLARFYSATCDLQDRGVPLGSELEQLLTEYERKASGTNG